MSIERKIREDLDLNIERTAYDVNQVAFISGSENQVEPQHQSIIDLNISSSFSLEPEEVYSDENLDLIVNKIASAMNAAANSKFKNSRFVEPSELEDVKKLLSQEKCSPALKQEFEKELTNFQDKIKSNYSQQLKEYKKERINCEMQLDFYETTKKELVMKRLSQMLWPYDDQTRAYDNKIATLKIEIARCTQKIEAIEAMRPAAKEKDLLIFQMQLKEKFIG